MCLGNIAPSPIHTAYNSKRTVQYPLHPITCHLSPSPMSEVTLSVGGRWRAADAERDKLLRIIAHLNNEVAGLKTAYTQDIELVNAHKAKINEAEDRIVFHIAQRDEWQKKYFAFIADNQSTLVENNALREKNNELETRIKELETNMARRDAEHAELHSTHTALQTSHGALKSDFQSTESGYSALSKNYEHLRNLYSTHEITINKLQNALQNKNKQIAAFIKERENLKNVVAEKEKNEKFLMNNRSNRKYLEELKKEEEEESGEEEKEEENEKYEKENTEEKQSTVNNNEITNNNAAYSTEESKYYKSTIIRQKKHIYLLEQKQLELENIVKILERDNKTLAIRYKGATDLRLSMDKKIKSLEKNNKINNNTNNNGVGVQSPQKIEAVRKSYA